jgi:hypothetical protein
MEKFVSEIIRIYLKLMCPGIDDIKYVGLGKGYVIRDQSTAGAWIELPLSAEFELPSTPSKHIWDGLVANVNGKHIIIILAYTEGREFQTIELASALDDYPEKIIDFEFFQFPEANDELASILKLVRK